MHHTAAAVLRLLFRFVFKLAVVEKKKKAQRFVEAHAYTHARREAARHHLPCQVWKSALCNSCPALLLVDTAGRATACTGLLGELSRAPAVSQQFPPPQSGLEDAEGVGEGEGSRVLKWLQVVSHTALGKQCRLAGTAATTREDNCSCPSFLFQRLPSGHAHTPCMCTWRPRSVG